MERGLEDAPLILKGRRVLSSAIAVISARTNFVVSQRLFVVAEFVGHLQASVLFCSPCDVSVAGAPPPLSFPSYCFSFALDACSGLVHTRNRL